MGGDGEQRAAVGGGHSGVRANMSRDSNLPPCASAGLSKSERVIFGLSFLRARWWSGLTSSDDTLETETALSGVRGI